MIDPVVFYRHGRWWAQAMVGPYLVTGIGATPAEAEKAFRANLRLLLAD